jgi:hypothetical protein
LPDIPYRKEEEERIQKKKLKKKRSEKNVEERIQKPTRKREVKYKKTCFFSSRIDFYSLSFQ